MKNKQQHQIKVNGAHLYLLAFLFAFSVKAQTFTSNSRTPAGSNQKLQHEDKLNVYVENHKIIFSVPKELLDSDELVFNLFDSSKKLISSTCMKCCIFIDVSYLPSGAYFFVIKSGNNDLETGKLNFK